MTTTNTYTPRQVAVKEIRLLKIIKQMGIVGIMSALLLSAINNFIIQSVLFIPTCIYFGWNVRRALMGQTLREENILGVKRDESASTNQ